MDCFRTGQPVSVADLPSAGRWPRFTAAAAEVGFAAVHAVPMRLRTEVIGALNFFDTNPGALDAGKLRIGQALADVATIGLLQQRAIHRRDLVTEQLQTALNSRILIEQAKGVLAERLHVDVAEAFAAASQRCPQPQPAPVRTRPGHRRRIRADPTGGGHRPDRLTDRPRGAA